jgi:hypothetical protein
MQAESTRPTKVNEDRSAKRPSFWTGWECTYEGLIHSLTWRHHRAGAFLHACSVMPGVSWWTCDSRRRTVYVEMIAFDGIERIQRRIVRLADEIGYVVLLDRSDYGKEFRLGRLDLDETATAPWRREASDLDVEAPPLHVQANALCCWLRALATDSVEGVGRRRFRVKVFAPKGYRMVFSSQFACQRDDLAREAGVDVETVVAEALVVEPEPHGELGHAATDMPPALHLRQRRATAVVVPGRSHPVLRAEIRRMRPSEGSSATRSPRAGPPQRARTSAPPGRAPPVFLAPAAG